MAANELSIYPGIVNTYVTGIGAMPQLNQAGQSGSVSYVSGLTSLNTARARTAFQNWIAGTADAAWNYIGDSTIAGLLASGLRNSGARPYVFGGHLQTAYPSRPVRRVSPYGGAGKTAPNYGGYDNSVVVGSATISTTNFSIGGGQWIQPSNVAGNALRFTPPAAFDRVRLLWADRVNPGNAIVWRGSDGTTGQITPVNDGAWREPTLTMNGSCTWFEINCLTDTVSTTFIGIEVWNNADKSLFVRNMGWGGSRALSSAAYGTGTNGWTHSTQGALSYSPQNAMRQIAQITPGLCIINIGINDAVGGTTDVNFRTALDTMIERCAEGDSLTDGVVCTMNPLDPATVPQATQNTVNLAIRETAAAAGVPVFDVNTLMGSAWSVMNANGLAFDDLHPNEAGYAVIAQQEYSDLYLKVMAA